MLSTLIFRKLSIKCHIKHCDVINWIEKWLTQRRQRVIVWKSVLSGVSHGSVLGPILFFIYIYMIWKMTYLAKYSNLQMTPKYSERLLMIQIKQSLQDDLDKLVKWSEIWQMLFNFGKCKCIHIGHGNMDEEYKMGDAVLGRTTQEKDL